MNLHGKFIQASLLLVAIFCVERVISVSLVKLETLFVKVRLNGSIELDCTEFLFPKQSSTVFSKPNKTIIELDSQPTADNLIFIFKKNKLVYKKMISKLLLNVTHIEDEGVYECGYYEIDQFGMISYSTQKVWDIRIDYDYEASKGFESQRSFMQRNNLNLVNLFTSNPLVTSLFVIVVLISVTLFISLLVFFINSNDAYHPIQKKGPVCLSLIF